MCVRCAEEVLNVQNQKGNDAGYMSAAAKESKLTHGAAFIAGKASVSLIKPMIPPC